MKRAVRNITYRGKSYKNMKQRNTNQNNMHVGCVSKPAIVILYGALLTVAPAELFFFLFAMVFLLYFS